MEATVKQGLSYPAKEMDIKQKKTMALQVIRDEESITHIAKENHVSRKFVYKQKNGSSKESVGQFPQIKPKLDSVCCQYSNESALIAN